MATIPFVKATFNGQGDVYSATLSTGDETNILKTVNAEDNISVAVTGTVAGSTVTVQQTLDGTNFATAESIAGTALTLTTIGVVKRVASAGVGLKIAVSVGAASDLVVSVYIPTKVRP